VVNIGSGAPRAVPRHPGLAAIQVENPDRKAVSFWLLKKDASIGADSKMAITDRPRDLPIPRFVNLTGGYDKEIISVAVIFGCFYHQKLIAKG
jgi:hypothetical protein